MARNTYTVKERLFVTRKGDIVPAGHPLAHRLLYPAGRVLPIAKAEALGLTTSQLTFPTHVGGGWYELSNGERVQGRDEAEAAEAALTGEDTDAS